MLTFNTKNNMNLQNDRIVNEGALCMKGSIHYREDAGWCSEAFLLKVYDIFTTFNLHCFYPADLYQDVRKITVAWRIIPLSLSCWQSS